MTEGVLSVRPWDIKDFESIIDYFLKSDKDFLFKMGVDVSKLPSKKEWFQIMSSDFDRDPVSKQYYYVVWLLDGKRIGHSNINKIVFGKEAYMHLHMWRGENRKKGMGFTLLKKTLPLYFNKFKLKNLYCEPSASNPAPNKALEKLGFNFIESYDTVPGWINMYQTVNKWCLSESKSKAMNPD